MTRAGDTAELTEQDVLKAFDYETTVDAPMLTVAEVADALAEHFEIEVSSEVIQCRLREMESDELVASEGTENSTVEWTALVAPRLSDEVLADVEAVEGELERGETVSLDELPDDLTD
ncbi:helix-turn-helix domain-containing protein [Haloarcula sp. Atlit-7R]|uniref:helix-turn-helix domain-containing protein n=1 Tax=Haloarcula sp. Atlit-7R TaxID=2282125 RepID=UPI000EF133BB|nr:helix-turn-helix domain-containing protein [Haloarcula sp. Atlit-7R]RLM84099.1 helix-turn-helix domain-containing protein [Haloarcula sp. Atlit-7R]